MAAPLLWSLRELAILLNSCNQRSVGLRINGSHLTLELCLVHLIPNREAGGQPFNHQVLVLSQVPQRIWTFLGVPPLNLDKQFERHEEVFAILVKHRFFHISNMTTRLEELQIQPTRSAADSEELLILNEFIAWWYFNAVNMQTNIIDSTRFTFDEVSALSLAFFRSESWKIYRRIKYIVERKSTPGVAPIQVSQQQDQDKEAPQRDRSPQVSEITWRHLVGACAFTSSLVAVSVIFELFRRKFR